MELDPVGRVEDVDQLDLEPVTIPIVGYERGTPPNEVIERIRFRAVMPAGATFDVMRDMSASGGIAPREVLRYLDATVLPDDAEKLEAFLHSPTIEVRLRTMMEVHEQLMEFYSARPTMPRSASSGGGSGTKRTSQAASRKRASASKKSR